MSSVSNRYTSMFVKLDERLEIVAGSDLKKHDRHLIYDALIMRSALLTDLVGSTQADWDSAPRLTENWERTILGLKTLDVELYSSDWKTLRQVATSDSMIALVGDPGAFRRRFKHAAKKSIHYKWILSTTLALIGGCEDWFRKLNQWIVFDSRLNLTSLDLTMECCREYLEFESQMRDWKYPSRRMRIGQRAARDLFGDFVVTDFPFRPRHGNGATKEVSRRDSDIWHKNRQFRVDSEVIVYLQYRIREADWREWFYVPYKGLDRTCQLVCVPKAMTANRTISKEPTTLQYLQQDLFQALDDFFTKSVPCIDLHDQDRSRLLAQMGSADGSYATIDLSNASDSVSLRLIEDLFEDLPILYPLLATRSNNVRVTSKNGEIDTTIHGMQKFAPMGSAVCFPVECMVFAIMCEIAIREQTGRASRNLDYVVYGDDIVIKTEFADALIDVLTTFNFRVNADKSFISIVSGHAFREACGIECLDGEDITPLRLSRRLCSLTTNWSDRQAGYGVGMVDLLNRCYLYTFRTLRRVVSAKLNEHWWFHSLLRISASDYEDFRIAIAQGRPCHVRVVAPFVITDDNCDTQWRALAVGTGQTHLQRPLALVTCISARGKRSKHDANDYFSWCLRAVTRADAAAIFSLDATQQVTIRPRDLQWSTQWACLTRAAHF